MRSRCRAAVGEGLGRASGAGCPALQGRRMCALWGGAWAANPALIWPPPLGWKAGALLVILTAPPSSLEMGEEMG